MTEVKIPNTDMTARRPGEGLPWDIVDDKGNVVAVLPSDYAEHELKAWGFGYVAGRESTYKAYFRIGFETGRRMMRRDVLEAMGVYDSMRELQAMARILADIETGEDK